MADKALLTITEATTMDGADLLYAVVGVNSRGVKRSNLFKNATTLTASDPLTIAQIWNNAGVTFNGVLIDVTRTAAAAASRLCNIKVDGSSVFSVDKDGSVTGGFFGDVATVTGLSISGTTSFIYANGTAGLNIISGGFVGIAVGALSSTVLNLAAGTTAKSQIRFAASVAPTSPVNGDWWFDGTDLKIRVAGATKTVTLT